MSRERTSQAGLINLKPTNCSRLSVRRQEERLDSEGSGACPVARLDLGMPSLSPTMARNAQVKIRPLGSLFGILTISNQVGETVADAIAGAHRHLKLKSSIMKRVVCLRSKKGEVHACEAWVEQTVVDKLERRNMLPSRENTVSQSRRSRNAWLGLIISSCAKGTPSAIPIAITQMCTKWACVYRVALCWCLLGDVNGVVLASFRGVDP